jgi:hypothetical protein
MFTPCTRNSTDIRTRKKQITFINYENDLLGKVYVMSDAIMGYTVRKFRIREPF